MTARRTRTVTDQQAHDRTVTEYEGQGYEIVQDTAETTTLQYRDHGSATAHLVLFLFAGWWNLMLANLVYALYRRHATSDVVEVTHE